MKISQIRGPWIRISLCIAAAAAATVALTSVPRVKADAAKPEIEDIMKADFKGKDSSVLAKVVSGKATADQITKFVADLKALETLKPPKGTEADWKDRTEKLVSAAETLQSGDKTAAPKLKTAANCKACHELHQDKK
jgi:hypothetical protein